MPRPKRFPKITFDVDQDQHGKWRAIYPDPFTGETVRLDLKATNKQDAMAEVARAYGNMKQEYYDSRLAEKLRRGVILTLLLIVAAAISCIAMFWLT